MVTRYDHEPFGKRIQPNGATFSGDTPNVQAGFTGHHMDDDLGLVNMRGRIYDPSQRRFLSPDPFVPRPLSAQSYNRYSYVYNNPLNLVDPSGFTGEDSGNTGCDPRITSCNPVDDPPRGTPVGGTVVDNPSAAVCGGTSGRSCGSPPPVPKHHEVAPVPSVASKFHGAFVPIVGSRSDKWNPHTLEGRVQKELLGSLPEIDYLAATQPSPEVSRAVIGLIPGVNSALVFGDPKSSTFDKALAVGTDVLSVVGVGTVLKLGSKGAGLAKGFVVGVEVADGVAHVEGSASRIVNITDSLLRKGVMKPGHAEALGVLSACTKDGCTNFSRALNMFVNDAAVVEIAGTYRKIPAIHFYNPVTGVNVVTSEAGHYVTVFQLGESQLPNFLLKGALK